METLITEHKLYQTINDVLFKSEKSRIEIYSGIAYIFQINGYDDNFDTDYFRKIYVHTNSDQNNDDKRIDCICYLMKCILKSPKVLEFFDEIYKQATAKI